MSEPITYEVKVYTNGDKFWYLNDELHREDGPAIERGVGLFGLNLWWLKEWHLNGKKLSHSQWKKEVAKLNRSSQSRCD